MNKQVVSLFLLSVAILLVIKSGEDAAFEMARAFTMHLSSGTPGASSEAALCLCPEVMRLHEREGEQMPNGDAWYTTEANTEITFRGLSGSSYLEDTRFDFPLRVTRDWTSSYKDGFLVFRSPDRRAAIWLRFGGSFWQRGDPRWWCVSKWEAR